jgi:hypothetical protein
LVCCGAIKDTGERCKGRAIEGLEWCWNHDPAHEAERRRHGSKGGKRGGRGRPQAELAGIKGRLSDLADDVLEGSVDRQDAAVVGQLLNTVIRAVSVELKVKEQLELIERVEELERRVQVNQRQKGRRAW